MRERLGVSQGVFAHLLGVSVVLVKSWEGGVRKPSPMARRLMDTIQADPGEMVNARAPDCGGLIKCHCFYPRYFL